MGDGPWPAADADHALTASALKGDRETCLAAGCTAYLTKPIKQDVLLQAIRDYALVAATRPSHTAAATLRASERLARRAPAYLENCWRSVTIIGEALDRGDFPAVSILGHNMRGSGETFGFAPITEIGGRLELAADEADLAASRALLADLTLYLVSLEAAPAVD